MSGVMLVEEMYEVLAFGFGSSITCYRFSMC